MSTQSMNTHDWEFPLGVGAQGGLTIPRLIHERKDLYNFTHACPNIVYLQIGGNDLSDKNTSTLSVANYP
jgi:hypothetical protein